MHEKLDIEATSRTPAVSFDFNGNHLKISGESYPEDVTEFYGPVFVALDAYLGRLGNGRCRFDFELIYLNSSSAKAIMMLMDKLDAAAKNGASVAFIGTTIPKTTRCRNSARNSARIWRTPSSTLRKCRADVIG